MVSTGLVMVAVISLSRRYSVNPDNVATPIAAALGDLVTLSLLAAVASVLHSSAVTSPIIIAILIGYIMLIPVSVTLRGLSLVSHTSIPLIGHFRSVPPSPGVTPTPVRS